MLCNACGAFIPEDSGFCQECGAPQPTEQAQETVPEEPVAQDLPAESQQAEPETQPQQEETLDAQGQPTEAAAPPQYFYPPQQNVVTTEKPKNTVVKVIAILTGIVLLLGGVATVLMLTKGLSEQKAFTAYGEAYEKLNAAKSQHVKQWVKTTVGEESLEMTYDVSLVLNKDGGDMLVRITSNSAGEEYQEDVYYDDGYCYYGFDQSKEELEMSADDLKAQTGGLPFETASVVSAKSKSVGSGVREVTLVVEGKAATEFAQVNLPNDVSASLAQMQDTVFTFLVDKDGLLKSMEAKLEGTYTDEEGKPADVTLEMKNEVISINDVTVKFPAEIYDYEAVDPDAYDYEVAA